MAVKKIRGRKVRISKTQAPRGSLWLAGIGAVSLARKRSKAVVGDMIAEGQRLQAKAATMVHEARADTWAQVAGFLTPVRQRLEEQAAKGGKAVQAGIAGVLSRLGIPSKADIDELAQRVGALSRQLKTGR